MKDATQTRASPPQDERAQNAATTPLLVHTVAELQMALADKGRGQRIAALRKRTPGLTQQKVAEDLGIGYRTIQTWEAGTVVPEWDNVEKLAKYYKVRPEQILGEMPPMEPAQLDRIEAKLDDILTRLDAAKITRRTAAEIAKRAADRLDDTPPKAPRAPRGNPGKGRAA